MEVDNVCDSRPGVETKVRPLERLDRRDETPSKLFRHPICEKHLIYPKCGQSSGSSELCLRVRLKKRLFQDLFFNKHQIERIKVRNSRNFLGISSLRPLRNPYSFSDFALDYSCALKSQALCALDSGFLDTYPPTSILTRALPLSPNKLLAGGSFLRH